jgi:hypothetical protein
MKKTIPFELFGANQYIYFDILRLVELEKMYGSSIIKLVAEQDVSINFCLSALVIGMKQHYHKATPVFFAEKLEKYLEDGGGINDVITPIVQAIISSGLFGKSDSEDEIEKNELERTE